MSAFRKSGCLGVIAVVFLCVCGYFIVVNALFAPWIYTVGGGRLLPLWQGVGVVHAPSGVYTLYVSFSPTSASVHLLSTAHIGGSGYLCTPAGKRLALHLSGGAAGRIWNNMDGHNFAFTARGSWHPDLEFSGHWSGADLAMNDNGTVSRAFPPGTSGAALPVTFHEMNWWITGRSCPSHP